MTGEEGRRLDCPDSGMHSATAMTIAVLVRTFFFDAAALMIDATNIVNNVPHHAMRMWQRILFVTGDRQNISRWLCFLPEHKKSRTCLCCYRTRTIGFTKVRKVVHFHRKRARSGYSWRQKKTPTSEELYSLCALYDLTDRVQR